MSRSINGIYHVALAALGAVLMMTWTAHAEPSADNPEGPYFVQRPEVNLREAPNGDVLTVLNVNDKAFIVGREGEWAEISIPAKELRGWVFEQYLDDVRATVVLEDVSFVKPRDGGFKGQEEGDFAAPAEELQSGLSVAYDAVTEAAASTEVLVGDDVINVEALQDMETFSAGFDHDKNTAPIDRGNLPGKPKSKSAAAIATPESAPQISFNEGIKLTSPSKLGAELGLDTNFQAVGGNAMGKITAKDVNIRAEANTKSKSLGKLSKGEKIYFISGSAPWYLVSAPAKNIKGWVKDDYVMQFPRVEISGTDVRLREGPGTDKAVLSTLGQGSVFYEYERKKNKAKEEWVKIASSTGGIQGWVRSDFVQKTDKTPSRPFKVTGQNVNFRSTANIDGEIIAQLPLGTEVAVLGRNDKWAYAWFSGYKGWLYREYIEPMDGGENLPAPKSVKGLGKIPGRPSWKSGNGEPLGDRLIDGAREMLGTPYVWGGESEGGVDCSGLIYKLLTDAGASGKCLPRRASEQMAGLGFAVEKEDLQPGDLVFFSTYKPGPSHVGVYLGDGDFIHASSSQHKVALSNLSEGYYKKRYCGARRITQEELTGLK
ncbi:SH3 domain-containing protein [bacterium]|nr:SH3 domain-containing protein [bacterium]